MVPNHNPGLTPWWKSGQSRRVLLLIVLLVEISAIVGALHQEPERRAAKAFIAKLKNEYVLAWKDDLDAVTIVHSPSLNEILTYSQSDLGLSLARNPGKEGVLESAWMTPRYGTFVVHWKSEADSELNQMSFYRKAEADVFLRALRAGSYSHSILGHSILLVRSATP